MISAFQRLFSTTTRPSRASDHRQARKRSPGLASFSAAAAAIACVTAAATAASSAIAEQEHEITAIRASILHVGDGTVINNAVVIIENGRITAVGPGLPIPSGATTIDGSRWHLTPGLIDANATIESGDAIRFANQNRAAPEEELTTAPRGSILQRVLLGKDHPPATLCLCTGGSMCAFAGIHENLAAGEICPCCSYPNVDDVMAASGLITAVPGGVESSSEVVPHTRVIDGVNLRSPDFQRLLAGGVTTVSISPAPFAVIGPRSAIVRTAGPMRDRIVIAEHAVEAVVSSDAYRVGGGNQPPFRTRVTERTRRPTTRMGLAWVFRKAFADTIRRDEGLPITGSDAPSDAAMDILEQVLAGSIPLSIHSRTATDIASALNMTEEFGLTFTLLEGTEADRMTTELASRNIPVVFGPIYIDPSGPRAFTDETSRKRLSAVRTIHDAGLRMAITAQDLREEAGLVRQAMYAVRAGLSPAHAIRAVTLTPAQILGIDNETGSIEVGKRADLVLWSADPLDPASNAMLVMVGGRIHWDRR